MINADKKLTDNGHTQVAHTSLQLLPLIMNNIPQAVFWKDKDLIYLGCNRAFAEDAGLSSPEEIVGKTDFDMPWKDQAELYRADDRHVLDGGEPKLNYEEPQTTPSGSTTWLRTSKIPVYENDQIVAILGMYEDITAQKQVELDLLLRDRALASSLNAVIILNFSDNKPVYVNDALLKMTGYSFEDVKQLALSDITGDPEELPKIRSAVQTQGFFVGEELIKRKDGSTFPATFFTSLIRDNKGQPIAIQSSFFDISDRKRAEEALLENRSLYQSLVEVSPLSICRKDLAGRFTFANQRFLELSQITLADLVGKTDADLHPSELAEKYRLDDLAVMESGQVQEIIEERAVHEGGTALVQTIKVPIYDGTGKVNGIQISFWDITDRKRAEDAIHASEERFRRFTEATIEGLVFHEQGTIIDANPAAITMFGLSENKDFIGENLLGFIKPESHEMVLKQMQLETVAPYEVLCIHKDGSVFPVETSTRTYKYDNRIIRATSLRDITERKRAEADLLLRDRALASSLNAVLVVGLDFQPIYVNESFFKMTGYTREEAMRLTITDLSAYPEGLKQIDEATRTQGFFTGEEYIKRKDGSIFPTDFFTSYITDDKGKPIAIQTAFTDITERKRAEQALQESQKFLQTVMDNIPQSIFWKDSNLNYLGCNSAFALDAGVASPGDIPGKTDWDMPWKEQAELYRADDSLVMKSGVPKLNYEEPQTNPQGQTTWLRTSKIPLYDSDGNVTAVLGMYEDITERKQTEAQLQQEKSLSDAIINGLPGTFYLFDLQGKMIRWNKEYEKVSGYSAEEIPTMSVIDTLAPEDQERAMATIQRAVVEGQGAVEANFITRDGQRIPYYFAGQRLQIEDQIYMAGTGMDLTERKRLEAQVQEAFERRGLQVELSTQVSQSIASASSLEELYKRVVTQVKEQFGYYHTQLLRYEPVQDAVVLVTGYGETGAKMLATGHRLPMGEGLIGTAAASGETVLRPALENDPDWHPNPLLPETKGEIAVPIKLGDTILGVLDVQSNVADALDADDQLLLEGLCGQIAIAIDSTRLREDMSERLEEINRLYRSMSREGWQTYRESANVASGFVFDQAGLRPARDITLVEELFATVPLTMPGGEVIGNLAIADDPQRPLSSEDENFLQQVSEQVALALESARLFEQTQSALATIQENEARLSEALNIAKLGNWEYDVEKDRFTFNDQFYSIFHTTAERMGGYHLSSAEYAQHLVHPDDRPVVGSTIGKALASTDKHYSTRLEHRINYVDGGVGYISVEFHIERDDQGKVTRCYGANQDITERKRAEIVIQESRATLEEVMTVAGMANWELDLQAFVFTYNDRLYQMLGTTAEAEGGYEMSAEKYVGTYIHPDDAALIMGAIQEGLQSPDPQNFKGSLEYRMIRKDGELRYMLTDYRLIVNQEGRPISGVGSFLDITERKLAELTIARRAEELKTVATVSTTASSVLDPDQLLQSVVDLTKERFGLYHAHIYTYDQAWNTLLIAAGAGEVGRKLVAEEHAIPLTLEQSLVARAARERKPIIVNDVNSEPGFLPNPLLSETRAEMAVPMTVGDTLLGVFDVQSNSATGFSDEDANIYVTLAAQVGVALQNARSYVEQAALVTQLRELDRLKSSFLANMSHELRTPLNSILGFADVIIEELDGPLTENMSNDLRLIQKNGQHLLHLINDVLDMAKIEAGRMNLNPERFTAFEVIEEVTSITSTLASEKNLALFIEPDADQNVKIFADRTRLRQVMINLVNNAIKFTENGKISLKLVALEGARVLYTIKDTGIGIPPDKLDAVFQEFTQVDSSTTRKAGGTGLGLPISRRLVEMHGGRLWAESTGVSGEGSTFFVELPVEARITETVEKQAK